MRGMGATQAAVSAGKDELALPARVNEIHGRIADAELRQRVETTSRLALTALAELKRLHLPQDHFEEADSDQTADDRHVALAPYMLAGVAACNRLIAQIAADYAPPAGSTNENADDDFDLEFDLVDGAGGNDQALSRQAPAKAKLTPAEQVADAAHAYGGMLRSRVVGLADRLTFALKQRDTWPLLAELDDAQHKLEKSVMGLLFGVLGVFGEDVRRDEILPEYRSATSEAVALRAALAELTYHVGRVNGALGVATAEQAVPLVVALADRLSRFAERREYRTMRAEDKKAVIDFRTELYRMRRSRTGFQVVRLRQTVEGFSKFLESMSAINHREVLVLHDRQRLEQVAVRLEEASTVLATGSADRALQLVEEVVDALGAVVGRNPELDEARRSYRLALPGPDTVADEVPRWQALVRQSLAMVG